jgi:hypothetical protein
LEKQHLQIVWLGFIHLPNDELNGEPIIKNPWLYPLQLQHPLIPFPNYLPILAVEPAPVAPLHAPEAPHLAEEAERLIEPAGADSDDAEVELLIHLEIALNEEGEKDVPLVADEKPVEGVVPHDEEAAPPSTLDHSVAPVTALPHKKMSVEERYEAEFQRLTQGLPPPSPPSK